jgi:hypothetical protein
VTRASKRTAAAIVFAILCVACASSFVPGASASIHSRLCKRLDAIGATVPSLEAFDRSGASAVARTLSQAADDAPTSVEGGLRSASSILRVAGKAKSDEAMSTIVAARQGEYDAALAVIAQYRAKRCATPLPKSPSLPNVPAAQSAACDLDARTINIAEDAYFILNRAYASMGQLIDAGLLRGQSSFFSDVAVDDPPGGYTIVPVDSGPCLIVPVAG